MSFKRIANYSICILIGLNPIVGFSATVNFATNSTVTVSNSSENNEPEKAIDANAETGWSSGNHPFQWIEIDLGSRKEITEITALVDQKPAGDTVHNVYLDNELSHTWSGITNKGDLLTWALPQSIKAQRIRIETPTSPSWVAWYEISALGSDVPSPISEEYQKNASTLSNGFDISIPVIEYNTGQQQLFYSANLIYIGANSAGELLWKLGNYAPVENIQTDSVSSHLSNNPAPFFMKIDSAKLGAANYWAHFEFIGDNGVTDDLVWKLTNNGFN